jgi:hypothetical protein
VYLTNLKIFKQRIQSFQIQSPLEQSNKSPAIREDNFELKIVEVSDFLTKDLSTVTPEP